MGEREDVKDLIADSRLLVAYATRMGLGKAADITALIVASDEAEAQVAAGHLDPTLKASLTARVADLVRVIAPVTLLDLGSKWTPFKTSKLATIGRVGFAMAALVLIAATAYYTDFFLKANETLGQLNYIQTQNAQEKADWLYRAFKKNYSMIDLANPDEDNVHVGPFMTKFEELSALNDKMNTYVNAAYHLSIKASQDPIFSELVEFSVDKSIINGKMDQSVQAACNDATCKPLSATRPVAPALKPAPQIAHLTNYEKEMVEFLTLSGLPTISTETAARAVSSNELSTLTWQCKNIVETLYFLVLPALFGMLGCMVYQLRRILNPLVPNLSADRIAIRIALGGLAGVTVSLVLGPLRIVVVNGEKAGMELFGLAFLVGFSVDLFFRLLDGAIAAVSKPRAADAAA